MDQLKLEAERLRLGIRGGWIPIPDAIAWADRQIGSTSASHESLIGLSLAASRSREEVAGLLALVPGVADSVAVMRSCLADLLKTLEREPALGRQIAKWLYFAGAQGDLPEAHFGWEPLAIDDEFALAAQGVSTTERAQTRLLAFLRKHAHA